jgi:hypothetical protein
MSDKPGWAASSGYLASCAMLGLLASLWGDPAVSPDAPGIDQRKHRLPATLFRSFEDEGK